MFPLQRQELPAKLLACEHNAEQARYLHLQQDMIGRRFVFATRRPLAQVD